MQLSAPKNTERRFRIPVVDGIGHAVFVVQLSNQVNSQALQLLWFSGKQLQTVSRIVGVLSDKTVAGC